MPYNKIVNIFKFATSNPVILQRFQRFVFFFMFVRDHFFGNKFYILSIYFDMDGSLERLFLVFLSSFQENCTKSNKIYYK